MRPQAVLLRDIIDVYEEFRLRRIEAAPIGLLREGERIEMRGNIASAAGIDVVAPGAAKIVSLLDDDEILATRHAHARAHAQAA